MTRPLRIGLTGGVASGKTAVADMLQDLGAAVVDADVIAREVVAPDGPAYADVVSAFGPEVVGSDGALDRQRLGSRVFAEPAARLTLNTLTHPHIRRRMIDAAAALAARPDVRVIVFDIPLLLDTTNGDDLDLDGILVVSAPDADRLARLRARNGLSEDDARRRLASQVPLDAKVARATWVIDNGGTREATRAQVERLWARWMTRTG